MTDRLRQRWQISQPAGQETILPVGQLPGIPINMLVCFANTKGGVGKSTLAVHLAVWLHDRGAKVALLDCDQQRSSSTWTAEAEPRISIGSADTPEDVLLKARELAERHDFVVGDGPGGLDDRSRTLLILADLAIFPITPSVLDLRSVAQATSVLKYAQGINQGKPEGRLVLNRMRTRDTISRELKEAAPSLGLAVAHTLVRDLQVYRDAAQQGTAVTRLGRRGGAATAEITQLFVEIMTEKLAFFRQLEPKLTDSGGREHDGRQKTAG